MAKQVISSGSSPNDGTGDTLYEGANKINNNFAEIYSTFGDGSALANVTGPQGPIGLQGLQGFQGFTGPQGSQGFTGPQGSQGLIGPQGSQGLIGPQGSQGLRGPQGSQGLRGPQGSAATNYWVLNSSGINTTSNVGIGTTTPTQLFQVGSGSTRSMVVTGIGSVGIGTTIPQYSLDVNGNVRITGNLISSSTVALSIAMGM